MSANPNLLPSQQTALLAALGPGSVSPSTLKTAYLLVAGFGSYLATIKTGILGASATVDAKLTQAKDAGGSDAKDIPGKAITQIVKATGDNKQVMINLRAEELDAKNGYTFASLEVTVAVAPSDLSALLQGFYPRYGPADENNPASVVEIVT